MERHLDAKDLRGLFELIDEHGKCMRDFVISQVDGFFADDFCCQEPLGLISYLVFWEKVLILGKLLEDFFERPAAAAVRELLKRGLDSEKGPRTP